MIAFFLLLALAFAEETELATSSSIEETTGGDTDGGNTGGDTTPTQSGAGEPEDTTPAADEAYKNKKYLVYEEEDVEPTMEVTLLNVCVKDEWGTFFQRTLMSVLF